MRLCQWQACRLHCGEDRNCAAWQSDAGAVSAVLAMSLRAATIKHASARTLVATSCRI